jgi:hypothetical protein
LVFHEGPGCHGMSDSAYNRLSVRMDMDALDHNPLLTAPTKLHLTSAWAKTLMSPFMAFFSIASAGR